MVWCMGALQWIWVLFTFQIIFILMKIPNIIKTMYRCSTLYVPWSRKSKLTIIWATENQWNCWIIKTRLVVHDAPDGADPGAPATPLAEPLVLSGPNQVHLSPVVRVLVEEPVAIGYVAGEDVARVEAVHDAGAVIHQVHHLASKFNPLIQAHAEWPRLLINETLFH